MRALAEAAHSSGHISAPTLGVPATGVSCKCHSYLSQSLAMTIESMQQGNRRSPSGSSQGHTDLGSR